MKSIQITDLGALRNELAKYKKGKKLGIRQFNQAARLAWLGKAVLSPLDPVSARGRAKPLFGFDYTWEVYTPAAKRRFGYYVLPILWGDRLVGRFDPKLDRATGTLRILGLWLEDPALAGDAAFTDGLARGMQRFVRLLEARRLDVAGVPQVALRKRLRGVKG